ncbi:MAG: DUF177 domain-containing protein [Blautia sp.]|nr:DUF177 domain-containing protein [Blautia sp.]
MQINLFDVSSTDGKILEQRVPVELQGVSFQQGDFPVVSSEMLRLHIENVGDHVLEMSGEGSLTVEIPCARCLTPVHVPIEIRFSRKLDMKQSEQQRIEELDELSYLTGMDLDVDRLVYLEALIGWPSKVLCKEDCKGICSRCGKNLNTGSCDCEPEPKDPRMAAISDIFRKFKEV